MFRFPFLSKRPLKLRFSYPKYFESKRNISLIDIVGNVVRHNLTTFFLKVYFLVVISNVKCYHTNKFTNNK